MLIEMMKMIQNLRKKSNQETETLKRTQSEMKTKLKNPITQLESFTSSMDQAKDRISGLQNKIHDLDQINKKCEKVK